MYVLYLLASFMMQCYFSSVNGSFSVTWLEQWPWKEPSLAKGLEIQYILEKHLESSEKDFIFFILIQKIDC